MYTLIIVFFLVSIIASFLCSVLEAVLLSISPAYAQRQVTENPPIGQALTEYRNNVDRPLAAILTLNTIAHTVGAIGVGAQAAAIWNDSIMATIVVPVVMTLAILILSEIIPKTIGALYWKELTGFTVKTLKFIILILGPFVVVSQFITRLIMRDKSKSVLSRADFTAMAELGAKEGVFDERESTLLRNFMRFKSVNTESCDNCNDEGIAGTESQESDSESNETALNPDDELDADNTDTNSDGSSSVVNQNNDVGQSSDGINAVTSTQATDESGGGPIGLEGLIVFLFALRWQTMNIGGRVLRRHKRD